MYKNEEYLKKMIMGQSRHLFIYGRNGQERSELLQSLESLYPLTPDSSEPVALYFDSLALPPASPDFKDKVSYTIYRLSREYLSFSVATKILEKAAQFDTLDSKLSRLANLTNKSRNQNHPAITSAVDLLKETKASRDFYYESYMNYIKDLIENVSFEDVTLPFLNLEMFVRQYKRETNMESYFGVVFDKKTPATESSIQAINNYIGSRINSDISIKVAVEPDDWETYHNTSGQPVEAIHDYGIIQLDDSYSSETKKMIKHL